jgi:hypothetical protein
MSSPVVSVTTNRARLPGKDGETVARIQREDLRAAASALETAHAGLTTHLYYARPLDGFVTFDPIARTPERLG